MSVRRWVRTHLFHPVASRVFTRQRRLQLGFLRTRLLHPPACPRLVGFSDRLVTHQRADRSGVHHPLVDDREAAALRSFLTQQQGAGCSSLPPAVGCGMVLSLTFMREHTSSEYWSDEGSRDGKTRNAAVWRSLPGVARITAGPSFSSRPDCFQKVWYFSTSSFASFIQHLLRIGQRKAQVGKPRAAVLLWSSRGTFMART